MISKTHRFRGPVSLRFVYRQGKTVRGPLFSTKTVLNSRRDTYRTAVVVSRKVHKSSVARNRMRRKLYEIIRGLQDDIAGPYDIVVTVFADKVLEEPTQSLNKQLRQQLDSAGVLSKRIR